MFVIEGREGRAEIKDQKEIDRIAEKLAEKGYIKVLGSVVDALCNAASVKAQITTDQILYGRPYARRRQGVPIGEMFFREQSGFVILPVRGGLQVWGFRHHTCQSTIEQFCQDFEEAARASLDGRRLRGMDFTWQSASMQSASRARYWEEGEEAKEIELGIQPDYTPEEVELTKLLLDRNVRTFVLRLAQVKKARAVDVSEGVDVQKLIDRDLIRQEYLIVCREDSHTISILPSQESLEQIGEGVRCPTCSRSFREELVQEIYVLTDQARSLISGSRWMSIWVTGILLENGVEKENLRWGLEINGEELDILLNIWGHKVFFELKDREFGLGDAYPFVYRVSRYGGSLGVVVTTDKVAKDAKKFLKEGIRTTGLPGLPVPAFPVIDFRTIEGESNIPKGVNDLVNELAKSAVLTLVSRFGEFGLNVEPVVQAWLDAQISQNA